MQFEPLGEDETERKLGRLRIPMDARFVINTYWVNLIGKGYPAPRKLFRWCTDRLKIMPSNKFVREVVREAGEALLVLGTRKAESQRRAATMDHHELRRVRDRLTASAKLPNSRVYTPIEDWTNDDVWLYLMQAKNPWGHDNKSLLTMYQGATSGGECPLVVDTSTPSCGTSRFGCWVCTLVDQDRSMKAMIANDEEKAWMTPLLELRNELGAPNDRARRDYRRIDGRVQLFHDSTTPPSPNRQRQSAPILYSTTSICTAGAIPEGLAEGWRWRLVLIPDMAVRQRLSEFCHSVLAHPGLFDVQNSKSV